MARNRQRAKERQARRRAGSGDGAKRASATPPEGPAGPPDAPAASPDTPAAPPDASAAPPAAPPDADIDGAATSSPQPASRDNGREELREEIDLEVGAPPEDLGRSDGVVEDEPELDDDEHFDPAEDTPEEDLVSTPGPRGRRGGSDEAQHKDRSRLVQFLFAVRAELARVQWPDRQALVTLTGVVLGFVVIAGSYLGLLDAIVSEVIQAIL